MLSHPHSTALAQMVSEYEDRLDALKKFLTKEIQQLKGFQLTLFHQQFSEREQYFDQHIQKLREILDWCTSNPHVDDIKSFLQGVFSSLQNLYELMDQYHGILEKAIHVHKTIQSAIQKVQNSHFASYDPQGVIKEQTGFDFNSFLQYQI
jgi:hypothetical protein